MSRKRGSQKSPHREQRTDAASSSASSPRRSSRLSLDHKNKAEEADAEANDDTDNDSNENTNTNTNAGALQADTTHISHDEVTTPETNQGEENKETTAESKQVKKRVDTEKSPNRKRGRPILFREPSTGSPTSTAKPSSAVLPARKRQKITATDTTSSTRSSSSRNVEPSSVMRRTRSSDVNANANANANANKNTNENTDENISPVRKSNRAHRKRSFEIQGSEQKRRDLTNSNGSHSQSEKNHISKRLSRSGSISNNIDSKDAALSSPLPTPLRALALDENWRQLLLQDLQRKVRRKADPYGFFSKPVDPEKDECPDYYDIVDEKDSMCFNTMGEMIDSNKIKNIDQYQKCLLRIAKCARLYNTDEDNFVRIQADLMEPKSEGFIKGARERWADKEEREEREREEAKMVERQDSQRGREERAKRLEARFRSDSLSSAYVDHDGDGDDDDDTYTSGTRGSRRRRNIPPRKDRAARSPRANKDGVKRSQRKSTNDVVYDDEENSIGSLSESDMLNAKNDGDEDGDEDGPIEGSDIPFCKPVLAGSIMTPCNTREDWLKICPQLAIVCNEAARRSTLRVDPGAKRYEKPLSEIYIKERLEYDDPLEGFIVRTKSEPRHVQGFVLATRFTTWRKTFRWVTDEPAALITPTDHRLHLTDRNGNLTRELQTCERDDSNPDQGYKYNRICEISLLGGLGCGGALLSRTLSELRQSQSYDFVVLQSTKIAIPFYEKHGFVRVGAVTRFNDVEMLPEVAYRHWSEIVNGEAVESSYMMARRLKATRGCESTNMTSKLDDIDRRQEIQCALKSAYALLSDALTIRIGSVAYTNSFREILSAAREYAISADDYLLVKLVDKALSEFTGSQFGKSKRLLRSELRHGRSNASDELKRNGYDDIGEFSETNGLDGEEIVSVTPDTVDETTAVSVSIKLQDDEEEASNVNAVVPVNFLAKDDVFDVKIIVDGDVIGSGDGKAYLSRSHKATKEVIDATKLAVDNLISFVCKRSNGAGLEQSQVGIGDEIMVKILAFDGSPLWIDATVKKRSKIRGSLPYYSGNNGFQVEWDEHDGLKRETRVLDIRNRGVGKDWCTEMDWASFSVLPIAVLDSLLIGSKVSYPAVDGQMAGGLVSKRIGAGLENEFLFRVEIGRDKRRGRQRTDIVDYDFEDLSAGAIREAIAIPDTNIVQTRRLLKNSVFVKQQSRSMADDDTAQTGKESKQNKKPNFESAEAWSEYRIQEHKLIHISDTEKLKRMKSCSKVDEYIIRLSTGIGNSVKGTNKAIVQSGDMCVKTLKTESDPSIESIKERRVRKRSISFDESCNNSKSTLSEEETYERKGTKRRKCSSVDATKLRRSTRGKSEEQEDE